MQDLNKPITQGYDFNLNNYIKEGWELFKAHAGSFIGMTVLFIVIQIILIFIPYLSSFNNLLSSLLYAGYFVYCRNIFNQTEDASDFFKGFNRAGQIILYKIVYIIFLIPFFLLLFTYVIPFGSFLDLVNGSIGSEEFSSRAIEEVSGNSSMVGLSLVIAIFGTIYLSVSYIFTLPLIMDTRLDFWQAMELSRKVVGKRFFQIFLSLLGLGIVFSLATAITCGVGLLVATPLAYTIIFSAYDQIYEPYKDEFKTDLEVFGEEEKDINTESQEKQQGDKNSPEKS